MHELKLTNEQYNNLSFLLQRHEHYLLQEHSQFGDDEVYAEAFVKEVGILKVLQYIISLSSEQE